MIILGLDQAPSCIGFAWGEPGARPALGRHENPDYGANEGLLMRHVREWLVATVKSTGADAVFFEQVILNAAHPNPVTYQRQLALQNIIQLTCVDLGVEAQQVLVADWRREFYAGARPPKVKGENLWKEFAVKECARRGWWTDNHDAAEAAGIWWFGCLCADPALRRRARIDMRRAELKAERARYIEGAA